jgi:hypothetical protein
MGFNACLGLSLQPFTQSFFGYQAASAHSDCGGCIRRLPGDGEMGFLGAVHELTDEKSNGPVHAVHLVSPLLTINGKPVTFEQFGSGCVAHNLAAAKLLTSIPIAGIEGDEIGQRHSNVIVG